jgi:site-specific recombinase XerD
MNTNNRKSFIINDIRYSMTPELYRQIPKANLRVITEYDALQKANGNTVRSRENRVRFLLYFSRETGKLFSKITKQNIISFLGKDIGDGTRNSYVEQVKHFFKWFGKEELVKDFKQKQAEDFLDSKELLTDKEIYAIIEAGRTHVIDAS